MTESVRRERNFRIALPASWDSFQRPFPPNLPELRSETASMMTRDGVVRTSFSHASHESVSLLSSGMREAGMRKGIRRIEVTMLITVNCPL